MGCCCAKRNFPMPNMFGSPVGTKEGQPPLPLKTLIPLLRSTACLPFGPVTRGPWALGPVNPGPTALGPVGWGWDGRVCPRARKGLGA